MTEWAQIFRDIGFPAATLLLISYSIWRVAAFGAPLVQALVEAHKGFLNRIADAQATLANGLVAQEKKLDAIHEDVKAVKDRE